MLLVELVAPVVPVCAGRNGGTETAEGKLPLGMLLIVLKWVLRSAGFMPIGRTRLSPVMVS